jgi:hypothetical protein
MPSTENVAFSLICSEYFTMLDNSTSEMSYNAASHPPNSSDEVVQAILIILRAGRCTRSVLEWSRYVSDLWLNYLYGPVYYETNAVIMNGDMLKAWHRLIVAAHS